MAECKLCAGDSWESFVSRQGQGCFSLAETVAHTRKTQKHLTKARRSLRSIRFHENLTGLKQSRLRHARSVISDTNFNEGVNVLEQSQRTMRLTDEVKR